MLPTTKNAWPVVHDRIGYFIVYNIFLSISVLHQRVSLKMDVSNGEGDWRDWWMGDCGEMLMGMVGGWLG